MMYLPDSCRIALLTLLYPSAVDAADWPTVAPGSSTEITGFENLPETIRNHADFAACVGLFYRAKCRSAKFEFFRMRNGAFYVLFKQTILYDISALYLIQKAGIKKIQLPIGNQTEGVSVTDALGGTQVDPSSGSLTTSFIYDYCGEDVNFPEYAYQYNGSEFVLVGEREWNCGTGTWKSIWKKPIH